MIYVTVMKYCRHNDKLTEILAQSSFLTDTTKDTAPLVSLDTTVRVHFGRVIVANNWTPLLKLAV